MYKKYLIIITVIVLLLGVGGFWFYSGRPSANGQTTKTTIVEQQTQPTVALATESPRSLRSLLASGVNQKCTFDLTRDNYVGSGLIYISGGKVRGEITAKVENTTTITHMMVDGNTSYIWMGDQLTGFKMTVDPKVTPKPVEKSQNTGIDPNQETNYICSPWVVDSSLFKLPSNIKFSDFSSLLVPTSGATGSAGVNDKCAACSYLTGDAKAQCLTTLGCSN